ncbi:MAG: hypothetical protein HYZ17_03055 [Betaproteobacteria bacterium]|nr:hypothetical protein [Betaproteobacteria bacterium]
MKPFLNWPNLVCTMALIFVSAGARGAVEVSPISPTEWFILGWLIMVSTGIVLGIRERVVVFRDAADYGWVLAVAAFLLGALVFSNSRLLLLVCLGGATAALLGLSFRTAVDNPSPWRFAIALVTKLTLAVFLIGALKDMLNPTGESAHERERKRQSGMLWLVVLVPLVWRLTRDKPSFENFLRRALS